MVAGDRFQLTACSYNQLPNNTVVINNHQVEFFLWIELPHESSAYIELFQIDEISSGSNELNYHKFLHRAYRRPWIRLNSGILNLEIGQHIYKMSFIDTRTDDVLSLYFSYILQNDNPDKPYVYMDRDRQCCNCSYRR